MKLEAFRRDRLAAAARAAAQMQAAAEAGATGTLQAARLSIEEQVEAARRDAEAEADRELHRERGRSQREARRAVLEARRAADEALLAAVLERVPRVREDPAYGALLDSLEGLVRDQLGDGARILRDPPDAGGVVGEADGRRVDYRLPALAARCLDQLGDEVARLWS